MHITIITGSLSREGTTADVKSFAAFLCAQGHDVELLSQQDDIPKADAPYRTIRVCGPDSNPLTCARYLHKLSRLRSPDVILVTSDSYSAMLAATLYQRTTYVQRHHPRLVFLASSLGRAARIGLQTTTSELLGPAASRRITAMLVRSAAAIVVTGRDISLEIQRRHGAYACADKLHLVRHWCNGGASPGVTKAEHPLVRKLNLADAFVIVHHGIYGADHDVAALAQAIELTSTDHGIVWLFSGDAPQLEQLRRRHGEQHLANVRHVPQDDNCSFADLLQIGDVHVISQAPQAAGVVSTPRLAQIMAATKPVITVAPDDADCSAIVRENKAGFAVPSGRGEVLARAVWQLRDSVVQRQVFGRAGRLAFERHFSSAVTHPCLMNIVLGQDGNTAFTS